jgi:hypothetical protein
MHSKAEMEFSVAERMLDVKSRALGKGLVLPLMTWMTKSNLRDLGKQVRRNQETRWSAF